MSTKGGEQLDHAQFIGPPEFASLDRVKSTLGHWVKSTIGCTIQLATNWLELPLQWRSKPQMPQMSWPRLNEDHYTDTLSPSIKVTGRGWCTQVLVRKEPMNTEAYGTATESQGKESLEEFIAEVGALRHMVSDNA